MPGPLIAVVGDASTNRQFRPPMADPAKAARAAEELGTELARRGARLLVYGGPFIESDFVRGFVAGAPRADRSILMWYTKEEAPPPFPEQATHPRLFTQRIESGSDWEVAFYRSIAHADGLILIGGGNSTMVTGQMGIGARMPILALSEFGGAAARVWDTLLPGEDLPTREEKTLMAQPWTPRSAEILTDALYAQLKRRRVVQGGISPKFAITAAVLFALAVAIGPLFWGRNSLVAWAFFLAPLIAGGAGAAIRPVVFRRNAPSALLDTVVVGLLAGGISAVLFITAQLSGNPNAADQLDDYARRSIPYALGIGFIAGLTSDAVFKKLSGLEVARSSGIEE